MTEKKVTFSEVEECYDCRETFRAFGMEKTIKDWARKLGIPRIAFWYHMKKDGLSIEEIFKKYGMEGGRKERAGTHRARTRELVWLLLRCSGYIECEEEDVRIEYGPKTTLEVYYKQDYIGRYNYITDRLVFRSKQALPLFNPISDDQTIYKNRLGMWDLSPQTRVALAKRALAERAGIAEDNEE